MNNKLSPRHSVHRIFVVMIFGLFLLFLLLMLLFGARAYSVSVAGSQKNNNLYTASAYVTAKLTPAQIRKSTVTLWEIHRPCA